MLYIMDVIFHCTHKCTQNVDKKIKKVVIKNGLIVICEYICTHN